MQNYKTFGELLQACCKCKTKQEAQEVMRKAEEDNPGYTKGNIGYMLGYLSPEERKRVSALFEDCDHPVFGHGFGRTKDVSAKEAFNAGLNLAKNIS